MSQEIYIKLDEFKKKPATWHKSPEAHSALRELKELLPDEDYLPLSVAHFDFRYGQGVDRFYRVIENLISKYRQGPQPQAEKTFL